MTIAASIRADARSRLRNAVLDEAFATTVAQGWSSVRMGRLAAQVGVSRQTIHNEFGTREGLGEALVLRESAAFLTQILQTLQQNADDLPLAIRRAATLALELLPQHPLLRAAAAGPGDSLLPQFTSRSGPLLQRATQEVSGWVLDQRRDADPQQVRHLVDAVVRLVISYAVTPHGSPEATGQRLADLFAAGLGWSGVVQAGPTAQHRGTALPTSVPLQLAT